MMLSNHHFVFRGEFYMQIEGVVIGSPVSPIVSNLFMENFETKVIATFPHQVKVWGRYVDDTFVVIKASLRQQFTDDLNSQHPSIKFTTEPVISHMTSSVFMSQIIWGNRLFTENVKYLYIKSWVNCNILYFKDLFDESGVFLNENIIVQRLVRTYNWMIEYLIVKKCILPLCHQFDTSVCQYINTHKINQNNRFLYINKFYSINDLKFKFYYSILVEKKSERSCNEQYWQCLFQLKLLHTDWSDIYTSKIWNMPIKKIAEFNYKLLCRIITCRYLVSKWKYEVTPYCLYCHDIETV